MNLIGVLRGPGQVDGPKLGGSEAPQRIKDPHSKIEDLRMKVEDRRSKTVLEDDGKSANSAREVARHQRSCYRGGGRGGWQRPW